MKTHYDCALDDKTECGRHKVGLVLTKKAHKVSCALCKPGVAHMVERHRREEKILEDNSSMEKALGPNWVLWCIAA